MSEIDSETERNGQGQGGKEGAGREPGWSRDGAVMEPGGSQTAMRETERDRQTEGKRESTRDRGE